MIINSRAQLNKVLKLETCSAKLFPSLIRQKYALVFLFALRNMEYSYYLKCKKDNLLLKIYGTCCYLYWHTI